MRGLKFVSVEFPDDYNVVGRTYWYLCELEGVDIGTLVIAPLGSHDRLQTGVVRRVMFAEEAYAPFPLSKIKSIVEVKTKI